MTEIADRLLRSRKAHTEAKRSRRDGRVDDALTQTTAALTYRIEAHDLDPDHLDQAWIEEYQLGFLHDALLMFYRAELAKDQAVQRVAAQERLKHAQQVIAESLPAGRESVH